jgi:hypothetical protein
LPAQHEPHCSVRLASKKPRAQVRGFFSALWDFRAQRLQMTAVVASGQRSKPQPRSTVAVAHFGSSDVFQDRLTFAIRHARPASWSSRWPRVSNVCSYNLNFIPQPKVYCNGR